MFMHVIKSYKNLRDKRKSRKIIIQHSVLITTQQEYSMKFSL